MRFSFLFGIAGLLLVLSLAGCTSPGGGQNYSGSGAGNQTGSSGSSPLDERHFIYELGNPASAAVAKTIVYTTDSPYDAHNVYGTVNLTVKQCLDLGDPDYRDICIRKAAVYLGDFTICGNASASYEPYCFYEFAGLEGDASVCGLIGDSSSRAACERRVAISTGNASLCAHGESESDGERKAAACRTIAESGRLAGKEDCRDDLVYQYLVEWPQFSDTLLWLSQNDSNATVFTWWDYGSAIDCLGLHSVVSGKDLNSSKVPESAYMLVGANESALAGYMRSHGASYLMIPSELVISSGTLGGKWGALNYLSCAWMNETTAAAGPGESECEADHLWETIFISSDPCNVSDTRQGFYAYKMYSGSQYLTYYPSSCISPNDERTTEYCNLYFHAVPAYCVAQVRLNNGKEAYAPYFLDRFYTDGSLMLDKGQIGLTYELNGTYHFGDVTAATLFYTNEPVWAGGLNGYGDRTTLFYDSIIYKGFFLDSIAGFQGAYMDSSGSVLVYKLEE